jgi:hypothetical protein
MMSSALLFGVRLTAFRDRKDTAGAANWAANWKNSFGGGRVRIATALCPNRRPGWSGTAKGHTSDIEGQRRFDRERSARDSLAA